PDDKVLATGGHFDSAVRLWELATGKDLRPSGGPRSYISLLASADGGKTLRVAGRDRVFRRWDWAADAEAADDPLPSRRVWLQAFSPDGKALATLDYRSNEIVLARAGDGEPRRLTADEEKLSALAFSADGKVLASGDVQGTLRLWDVASGRE